MPRVMEETVPLELVGLYGGCYCLSFAFATLIAYSMAVFLPSETDAEALATSPVTQVIFGLPIVFYMIQLAVQTFYLTEDSLKFLLMSDRMDECRRAVEQIYKIGEEGLTVDEIIEEKRKTSQK